MAFELDWKEKRKTLKNSRLNSSFLMEIFSAKYSKCSCYCHFHSLCFSVFHVVYLFSRREAPNEFYSGDNDNDKPDNNEEVDVS